MKNHLRILLARSIEKTAEGGELDLTELPPLLLETPKQKEFGDLSSNIAMLLAKRKRVSPLGVAELLIKNLEDPDGVLNQAQVAGPGFLNFTFSPKFCYRCFQEVDSDRTRLLDLGQGQSVQVEFASVNPTGPLHVGHGRVAVIGDVLARILESVGYHVVREYYVNDSGRQIENLGQSMYHRCRELDGVEEAFPEGGYPGEYVKDLAVMARKRWGTEGVPSDRDETIATLSRFGVESLLSAIQDDLRDFGIRFDSFFSEQSMRERGEVRETIESLSALGVLYSQEGALWFKARSFGDDKDRTVIKSDGDLTYFAGDIAYHRNKFKRGYNKLINVWGADHHGYVGRLKAAVRALGYDPQMLHVILVQMVQLTRSGTPVRMGKRLGEFVPLRHVLEEVGRDAARFFFLMRRSDSHLDFDLDLAKKESSENPVFYVQYAHARVASIFEQARSRGVEPEDLSASRVELARLSLPEELELIKKVIEYAEVVEDAAEELEPHRLVFYLLNLAGMFHRYYNRNRVLSEDAALSRARLVLVKEVQTVIRFGLHLLGVQAPVRMARSSEGDVEQAVDEEHRG